jgi:hypothetical protein
LKVNFANSTLQSKQSLGLDPASPYAVTEPYFNVSSLSSDVFSGKGYLKSSTDKPTSGLASDSEMRLALLNNGVLVNKANCKTVSQTSCTSLDQLPWSIALLLGQMKVACPTCTIVISGGTEAGHKTHAKGKAVFDLSYRDSKTNSFIQSFPKASTGGVSIFKSAYNICGSIFYLEQGRGIFTHWHVVAANLDISSCALGNSAYAKK